MRIRNHSNSVSAARDSIQEIKRIAEESLAEFHELSDSRMWRLSYLKRRFEYNDLDDLFRKYTERINQAYFCLFLSLQAFFSVVHILLVIVINKGEKCFYTALVDVTCYSSICFSSGLALYKSGSIFKSGWLIFPISMGLLLLLSVVNFAVPVFHYSMKNALNLRPAYTTLSIVACYVFLNVKTDKVAFALGFSVALCELLVLGLITYKDSSLLHFRLGSDVIYLLCVNVLGLYFRFTNELVKRRTFLDRRACVESTLKLRNEKEQQEQLLLSILPEFTMNQVRKDFLIKIEHIEKLNALPSTGPLDLPFVREYKNVTILYADVVNYTVMTSSLPVVKLLEILNELFGAFDDASEELRVLRIKFLGDCYYCVAGLPPYENINHAEACVDLGLKMISIIQRVRERNKLLIDMRIGVHTGKILSGIIGSTKWQFDIWSKDVQLANRMETTGEPGKVHLTNETYNLIKKQYYIVPTTKGIMEPLLRPFKVRTYLIFDQCSDSNMNRTSLPINMKRLSSIGEDLYSESNSYLTRMRSSECECEMETSFSEDSNNAILHRYDRRASSRSEDSKSNTIDRRCNWKRESGKKYLGQTKRRTAFMNSNIKKYHEQLMETNKMMEEAIDSMPLCRFDGRHRVKDVESFLLVFKDFKSELEYIRLPDPLVLYYIVTFIGLLICITLIEQLTLMQWNWLPTISYTSIAISTLLLFPLVWMHYVWDRLFGLYRTNEDTKPKRKIVRFLYQLSYSTTQSICFRIVLYVLMCSLMTGSIVMEFKECRASANNEINRINSAAHLYRCVLPWHLTQTLLLLIIANFLFLRIHVWLKMSFAIAISTIYGICVWNFGRNFYENSETYNYMMPSKLAHILSLIFLTLTLHLIDGQTDYMNRLDFLWNKRLESEQNESNYMYSINKALLRNILPKHVAEIYLDMNRNMQDIYHEQYSDVAVMFATVLDYYEAEDESLNIRAMNRIVRDFDFLLSHEKRVEKIKVTNFTYMVACGLNPGLRDTVCNTEGNNEHVAVILLKFAVNLIKTLDKFNRDSTQECKLRVGIANGEVMAGVVGSKKPIYDIWGDTVNVASRMDSTGIAGRIQITEGTAKIVQEHGFQYLMVVTDCVILLNARSRTNIT